MIALPLISALALAEAPGAEVPAGRVDKRPDRDGYVVPNVAYDTDDGFGVGLRGEMAWRKEGVEPYRSSLVAQGYATLRGYHHHRVRFDLLDRGPSGRLRLTGHFAYRAWLNDQYYGVGNRTTRDARYLGAWDPGDPNAKYYRYQLLQPFAQLSGRYALGGPWELGVAATGKWSRVEAYPGSLLDLQRPFGMDGGWGLMLLGGLVHDSREPELTPRSGVFSELTGRVSAPLPGGQGAFVGVFGSFRHYTALGEGAVFAWRVMGEWLEGDVPFYEMVHWGGVVPVTGFGGAETVRGAPFGRWRAPGKAVANAELRLRAYRHTLLGESFEWQLVPFLDVGTVFGAPPGGAAPSFPLHPAGGVGVHVVLADSFVGRIDPGWALDAVVDEDGSVRVRSSFGFYLVFDQTF